MDQRTGERRREFLPHLLPVDPTLHWANPPGGVSARDTRPGFSSTPGQYTGPIPIVTHLHGSVGVGDESDGYAEAWFLPVADDIPAGYATEGTWYDFFAAKAEAKFGAAWSPGSATFQYPNEERASTKWYHDHTLGLTRLNVYAGLAGFYLLRGGPGDDVRDNRTGKKAVLPGPAPSRHDPPDATYYEIPIAIQDRSFNSDGSLFYPDTRAFFDGITGPYIPDSDVSPIWNPEFFGNTMMVNGSTWPFQVVEQRRYRLRLLNGCQSRFLILDFGNIPGVKVWQIGNEGGFLVAPVNITDDHGDRVLLGPAERADCIVDFTDVPAGEHLLHNIGPDEPFAGGIPGVDFPPADAGTTGQVLQSGSSRLRGAIRRPRRSSSICPLSPSYRRRRRRAGSRCSRRCRCSFPAPRARRCWARWPAIPRWRRRSGPRSTGTTRSPRTPPSGPRRCGSSTTPPATPTRCTSTRSCSRSSTARPSSSTKTPGR
ncbi:hypothetical protein OV079_23090 [Nannocystis pusilla]|uniref:Plastocyanin-like domain-containing protein n=1 Tax=Nannocystis pusilla TaxID=889268 RepID=A0A9X3EQE4_9BACT|nr:hypothetical protein [Nannocystis pusilla]